MNEQIACETVTLSPRSTLVLSQMAYAEVSCRAGTVWITQYGDARDVVLKPGCTVTLDLPSATVMTASEGADVIITRRAAPTAPHARPSWVRRLAGLLDPRWSGRAAGTLRRHTGFMHRA